MRYKKTGLNQLLFMGITVALLPTEQIDLTITRGTQKTLLAIIELAKVLSLLAL